MLVPVLIGMDFIDTHGMIIDFNDGTAVCANHDDGEPFQLPRNSKKHLMVDIVDFLTMGQQCVQGQPNIHVILNESSGSEPFAAELFCRLWERRLMLNRKMGGSISTALRSSTSPSTSHGGQKSCVAFQDSAPTGSREDPSSRSTRSQDGSSSMAMPGKAHPRQEQVQQMGCVDPVRKVRFEAGIRSKTREPSDQCGDLQPLHGSQSSSRSSGDASKRHGSQRDSGESMLRQGGRRGASEDSHAGLQGSIGQTTEEGGEGETGNDIGKEWCRSFRHGRLPRCSASDSKECNHFMGPGHTSALSRTERDVRADDGGREARVDQSSSTAPGSHSGVGHGTGPSISAVITRLQRRSTWTSRTSILYLFESVNRW